MNGERLGVIAGGGDLPKRVAQHARSSGRDVFVLGIKGFASPEWVAGFDGAEVAIGEVGRSIRLLRQANCKEIVFAGGVRRPSFSVRNFDVRGALLLPELISAAAKGDDALLRVVVRTFENAGFRIIGADDVLKTLLAPAGPYGSSHPSASDWRDIRVAAKAAAEIGAMDVGQGAVARDGALMASEASDGTDAMLGRLQKGARSGVLVKRPKPMQELRIDLPAIGTTTVREAARAGLSGIAVEAGGVLVVDRDEVGRLADELGLFVYGFTPGELA